MDPDALLAASLWLGDQDGGRAVARKHPKGPLFESGAAPVPTLKLCDPQLEFSDPTPDIRELFLSWNDTFFGGVLIACEVRWSPRMTRCAGTCNFLPGGLVSVRLSRPLLSLRPRSDLVNTLLHEMIHAYHFVIARRSDRDGHGADFLRIAEFINRYAGTNITVYHTFHDEVKSMQKHVWRCNGECRNRPPFFGWVRRAMNRPPGPTDPWHGRHKASCGGAFEKVSEPAGFGQKKKKHGAKERLNEAAAKGSRPVASFFPKRAPRAPTATGTTPVPHQAPPGPPDAMAASAAAGSASASSAGTKRPRGGRSLVRGFADLGADGLDDDRHPNPSRPPSAPVVPFSSGGRALGGSSPVRSAGQGPGSAAASSAAAVRARRLRTLDWRGAPMPLATGPTGHVVDLLSDDEGDEEEQKEEQKEAAVATGAAVVTGLERSKRRRMGGGIIDLVDDL